MRTVVGVVGCCPRVIVRRLPERAIWSKGRVSEADCVMSEKTLTGALQWTFFTVLDIAGNDELGAKVIGGIII